MQYIKMIKLGFVFKFNVLLEVAERIKKKKTYKNRKGSTACDQIIIWLKIEKKKFAYQLIKKNELEIGKNVFVIAKLN